MSRRVNIPNTPRNVEGQRAVRTEFYRGELARIIKGCFKLKCPNYCDVDYVLNNMIYSGYLIITDTPVGVIPLTGTLTGYNYQNVQTKAIIHVPVLKTMRRTIGKDCELVYLERNSRRMFYNYNMLIDIYAQKLASLDAGIEVNVLNSKLAYVAEAESKAQASTIKTLFDRITEGEPMVCYRKDSLSGQPLNLLFNNLKQNFIVNDMQDAKRSVINEFLTMLGVNNANTDKKERLITSEVASNSQELKCNTELFRNNLKNCMEKVHKLFPNFDFELELQFDGRTEEGNDVNRANGDLEATT